MDTKSRYNNISIITGFCIYAVQFNFREKRYQRAYPDIPDAESFSHIRKLPNII